MGYSKAKRDGFRGKYTQHYDDKGHKTGFSKEKIGGFGNKYTAHYDNYDRRTGRTAHESDGTIKYYKG